KKVMCNIVLTIVHEMTRTGNWMLRQSRASISQPLAWMRGSDPKAACEPARSREEQCFAGHVF
ncbi:MAG TPA: hypothetical protein VII37_01760, partial [Candidatus Acidoferrum sp.]